MGFFAQDIPEKNVQCWCR